MLAKMNVTTEEEQSLRTMHGGSMDFCGLLELYAKVEEQNGYNWFNRWGYVSSCLFMATTVSTIGYGNLR